MEAAPAGKLKCLADDLAAHRFDFGVYVFQRRRVDHNQRAPGLIAISGGGLGLTVEPTAQAAIMEACIVRTPILKIPPEDLVVKTLGCLNVCGGELDVVHLQVVLFRGHDVLTQVRERKGRNSRAEYHSDIAGISQTAKARSPAP